MSTPTLLEILKTGLYIGAVGYGGPAILALMKRVLVHEKGWISDEEFMNAVSLSQILPGAIGVTLMGYIGLKLRGERGGILMSFAFAFPAMAAITLLAWAYFSFGDLKFVHAIFAGLGAMVVALLVNATLTMGRSVLQGTDRNAFKSAMIAALSLLGILYLRWNVVYIILISGAIGALFFALGATVEPGKAPGRPGPAVDLPPASWRQILPAPATLVVLLALAFWRVEGAWALFSAFFQIGSFAFGGGFAAIPLIQHVVVDGMHWLDLKAFRDGIALGQITPGPVFITAAFIGYKVQGIIGAVIATIGIFTPSLTAVMALGRAHAKIRDLKIVKAVIRGVLSGFIGLLLSVVLHFGIQSLVSWQTWAIFAVSVGYLVLWQKDVVWLILGTIGVSLWVFP